MAGPAQLTVNQSIEDVPPVLLDEIVYVSEDSAAGEGWSACV